MCVSVTVYVRVCVHACVSVRAVFVWACECGVWTNNARKCFIPDKLRLRGRNELTNTSSHVKSVLILKMTGFNGTPSFDIPLHLYEIIVSIFRSDFLTTFDTREVVKVTEFALQIKMNILLSVVLRVCCVALLCVWVVRVCCVCAVLCVLCLLRMLCCVVYVLCSVCCVLWCVVRALRVLWVFAHILQVYSAPLMSVISASSSRNT